MASLLFRYLNIGIKEPNVKLLSCNLIFSKLGNCEIPLNILPVNLLLLKNTIHIEGEITSEIELKSLLDRFNSQTFVKFNLTFPISRFLETLKCLRFNH